MGKSRWHDIFLNLKDAGFSVYPPATKEGECTNPYIVIRDAGTTRISGLSSTTTLYELLCYMPKNKYSTLDGFVQKAKEAMKPLEPMIMPMYFETSPFYDDSVKGYMVSVQYRNYKQII